MLNEDGGRAKGRMTMQNLSESQLQTLKYCYLFLLTLRPMLLSLTLDRSSGLHFDATLQLVLLNESRLLAEFPELAVELNEWNAGGVS